MTNLGDERGSGALFGNLVELEVTALSWRGRISLRNPVARSFLARYSALEQVDYEAQVVAAQGNRARNDRWRGVIFFPRGAILWTEIERVMRGTKLRALARIQGVKTHKRIKGLGQTGRA